MAKLDRRRHVSPNEAKVLADKLVGTTSHAGGVAFVVLGRMIVDAKNLVKDLEEAGVFRCVECQFWRYVGDRCWWKKGWCDACADGR